MTVPPMPAHPPLPPHPPQPPPLPQVTPAERDFLAMMDRQAQVAVQVSGAGQSQWNGQGIATSGGSLGVAHWNGTISYDHDKVIQPLRQMWQRYHAGLQNSPQDLEAYRNALQTMLHENSHMLSRSGEARLDSAQAYSEPHNKALEEGVSEAWARRNVNEYIRRLGLEQIAPGICGDVARDAYPDYTPATQALCQGLGHEMGVDPDEVMQRINNESAGQKWPAVADMVMDSSGLRNQIPPEQQPAARDRIQQAMQQQFAHLPDLRDPDKPMDAQAYQAMQFQSWEAGRGAVEQARQQVFQLRQENPVQQPAPQVDRDATVQISQADIQAAINNTQHGAQHGQHGAQASQPTRTAPNPAITPDMQRAMALTQSGVTSMSGARPLGPAQNGERQQTGAHTPQQAQPTTQPKTPVRGE